MFSFFGRTFAETATSENVGLQNVKHVDGVPLKKNGHGIRSINVFGWDINVYVANFYSATPVLSEADAMECHGNSLPMQLDFTFLRTVDQGRVVSAWAQQLEHSVTHRYEGYESDRDVFIDMFSSKIENGGTQTVQLVGEETVLVDQGVHKGSIAGRGFQRAFLSMWFGEKAVAEDLKANLLKGSSHFEDEQPAHPVAS